MYYKYKNKHVLKDNIHANLHSLSGNWPSRECKTRPFLALEHILLKYGVDPEHINLMKRETPIYEIDLRSSIENFTISNGAIKKDTLVPVNKIKGLSRKSIFKEDSWFELAVNSSVEIYLENYNDKNNAFAKSNINRRRIHNCLNFLKMNKTLGDYHKSLQTLEGAIGSVEVIYIEKEDFYFVLEGNHRTIMAKLTNSPFIKADIKEIWI